MPAELLDREAETARLEAAWSLASAGQPQLGIVWGRRRVGKTFLLTHFAQAKRAVFFPASQQAPGVELRRLYDAVARDLGPGVTDLAGGGFTSWESAVRFLSSLAQAEPLLVVFDEVPYLAQSTPGFASVIQAVWDHLPTGTRLMLVLTGSAVGTMESMLGSGGALRGRPSVTLRLDPLTLIASQTFLPALSAEGLVEAYAACGGYPLHLKAWDQRASTSANLLRLAGKAGGILLEDATGMLYEELPESGGYARVLAAIGRGRTRMSEIADEAAQRVEHPLDVLQRSGFVRRSVPLGAPKRARPIYEIADPYLAFWFSVLYSDLGLVDGGQGRAVLARRRPEWQRHLGWVFEEQARVHAARLVASGLLPDDLVIGRWWASSGQACEVDVLGLRGTRTALLGEAKWQQQPFGMRALRELSAKSARVPDPAEDLRLALWGRGGVEPDLAQAGVLGFRPADLLAGIGEASRRRRSRPGASSRAGNPTGKLAN